MKSYYELMQKWSAVEAMPLDDQLALRCKEKKYVPLDGVLAQYKGLILSGNRGHDYACVREYLVLVFGEQVITDLEAV